MTDDTICVALARVGASDQRIAAGRMRTVMEADLGPPIHSLVISGEMHDLEVDMLRMFAVEEREFDAKKS